MKTEGKVVSVSGSTCYVSFGCGEQCSGCISSSSCSRKNSYLCSNDADALPGDTVEVEISEKTDILPVMYIFLVPVALIMLSYLLFTLNRWLLLIGIPLLAAYIAGLRIMDKNTEPKSRVTKIIESNQET